MNNCYNNNNSRNGDEITETLRKLVVLQREAVREEIEDQMCDVDSLGRCGLHVAKFNTRPIQIFTDDDEPWHCPIEGNEDGCNDKEHERSCVFRVEKVEEGTATFRALKECKEDMYPGNNNGRKFRSTDSFITIKLANIAAIRCLKDTFVDICIR